MLISSTKRKQDFVIWVLVIALNLIAIFILLKSITGSAVSQQDQSKIESQGFPIPMPVKRVDEPFDLETLRRAQVESLRAQRLKSNRSKSW
jgi:hypothetical protein